MRDVSADIVQECREITCRRKPPQNEVRPVPTEPKDWMTCSSSVCRLISAEFNALIIKCERTSKAVFLASAESVAAVEEDASG